jgi:hypothetical protein
MLCQGWQFEWGFNTQLSEQDLTSISLNYCIDAEILPLAMDKNVFGSINFVYSLKTTSDYFTYMANINNGCYNIGGILFTMEQFNINVLPFDMNIGNYNACLVNTGKYWKVALLHRCGLRWDKTKLVSVSAYYNLVSITCGSIDARKKFFYEPTKELIDYIPKLLMHNWK